MDVKQVVSILRDLQLPAVISAVLTVLVKALSNARQRRSTESLLDWLGQASALEPFSGDDRALRALHELRQSLVFEKAFGLKAESQLRNELLLFAESKRESTRFQEVLRAGRLVSRLSPAQLHSPKRLKAFRIRSRISKPLGYFYIALGYILFIGGGYLAGLSDWTDRGSLAFGFVFGGLFVALGVYFVRLGFRYKIAADFLGWRSENTSAQKGK